MIIFHTNDNYELFFNGYEQLNNATLTIDLPYDFNFDILMKLMLMIHIFYFYRLEKNTD